MATALSKSASHSRPLSTPVRAISLYFLAVVVLGAILAPWLYWLVQWLAANVDALAWLARHPFKRVFNRSLLIVALAGLWPLLRNLGLRSLAEFGYPARPDWWQQLGWGLLLGAGSLLAVLAIRGDLASLQLSAGLLGKLAFTAIVVAVIEESFFRGGVQGAFCRGMHWLPALFLASVIYAALHFLKPTGVKLAAADVRVWSGFTCLGDIITKSYGAPGVFTAFVTLLLAGLIMGFAFQRTGALYLSIGLHAGWVFCNELARATLRVKIVEDRWAWCALVVVALLVAWIAKRYHVGPARTLDRGGA